MSADRLEGLRSALEVSPDNHALRLVLAESLAAEGLTDEALVHFGTLLASGHLPPENLVAVGRLAVEAGELQLAARLLERARNDGVVEGTAGLQAELERELGGDTDRVKLRREPGPEDGAFTPADLFEGRPTTTFEDVGGLDEVKKSIHRRIILPFQRPDLYLRYGRSAGGGTMLYGPPGCGKTLMARATAGECGLPFFNVRIEDVLDPFMGVSEQNLHEAFESARAGAPCVLFLDELDALAYARRKQAGSAGRPLVDQLLQELDAIGSDNEGVLVLGATNAPWDVDDALKRPGRLDHPMFVPPPDRAARERILQLVLEGRHTERIDVARAAADTPLYSGADLRALVEAAVDLVIDEAIDSGGDPPLETRHLDAARATLRPTTLEWLASARNYVEFANQAGRYDEVAAFLRSPEAKRLKEMLD